MRRAENGGRELILTESLPVAELMRKMAENGTAGKADLDLLYFTDSIEETMDIIRTRSIKKFGLKPAERRPWRILGELGLRKI